MKEELFAIIVAGGQGLRMGTHTPKQFIPILHKPILIHTISRFIDFTYPINIILVLPEKEIETWENICNAYNFNSKNIEVVKGGNTRFHSVQNGLKAIPTNKGLVAIHDGVRPFVQKKMIENAFLLALEKGNAIAAVPLKDSLRQVLPQGDSIAVERKNYILVQTPQVFSIDLIKKSYDAVTGTDFTDDASVAEKCGVKINVVEGNYNNIKITSPEDLILAESLAKTFQYQE